VLLKWKYKIYKNYNKLELSLTLYILNQEHQEKLKLIEQGNKSARKLRKRNNADAVNRAVRTSRV